MTQELTVKAENCLAVSTEFFGDKAIEEFINSRSANANTQSKYRRIIRQMMKYFAAQNIVAPTEDDANKYIGTLRAKKKSDYTIRLYSTVMKSFFKFLGKKGYYADIAADVKVQLKKSKTHNRKALTQNQAERLISAITGKDIVSCRNKAIIALALTTGVRTVEIARANREDFSEADGYWALKVQGKGRLTKDETVKVVPWVAQMILNYLDMRGEVKDADPLFASTARNNSRYGNRYSEQSVGKMIKATMKSIGIDDKKISAHSTRHYAATTAIKQGVDLREVSDMLRHSSLDITLTYLHDISLESRRAESAVAATLSAAAGFYF